VADLDIILGFVLFEAIPKVKHWITFNEPWCSSILGYRTGCSLPDIPLIEQKSKIGGQLERVWIVGHNLLLAMVRQSDL